MQKTFLIVILLTSLSACQSSNKELATMNGLTMGTSYSIKVVPNENGFNESKVHTNIENILADISQAMSTYIDDSEISLFNQSRTTDWQTLSADLYQVIEHGNQISSISNGAFDITLGPLVNLWGFGPVPYHRDIPSDLLIQSIKQHTGFEKLNFDKATHRVSKSDPIITIDLSGIAKGFAVDKVAQYLDGLGIADYLVEIGGELIGKGTNANQEAWQIGIEQANSLERSVQNIISLKNIAMATSGDYRNYFEKDGVRYSHTIDPVSGKPISHTLAAVTVLHKSAMHADALATAFMVSGPEKSLTLANKIGVALYMIIKTNTGFEERYNEDFSPYLTH
ncbi:MAG: FAD:protein FMN transferase [marine bacterium B5-7]|nr:MAG: FAD:protein FMN transferase [marine bacterium B5-7]